MLSTTSICLAAIIYYESEGSSIEDKIATGWVAMNRVSGEQWPNNPCDVAKEKRNNKCAYPWWCLLEAGEGLQRRSGPYPTGKAWIDSVKLSHSILDGSISDPTNGATYNCAQWATCTFEKYKQLVYITKEHKFYK